MAKCYYCGGKGILPSLPMDVVCPVCQGEGTLTRPKKVTDVSDTFVDTTPKTVTR